MCKRYFEYLKDNPERYWFKRKLFCWGWTPATWQGWAVLLGFVALIMLNFRRIDVHSHSASDTLINFIPQTVILTLVLLAICCLTGERPRWQWGIPKEEDTDEK